MEISPGVKHRPRWLLFAKHYIGLDRAIAFSVLGRGWSTLAGVVNVTLIAHFLTGGQQGYYYTFASLVAIQIIFELGFSFVILQLAAHERVALVIDADGQVRGSEIARARLASVLQKAVRWYSVAAFVMAVMLTIIGFRFFSKTHSVAGVSWELPWLLTVLASSLTFQIDPIVSFLEGCGKIVEVGRLRMTQGIVGSLLSWSAMLLHHGLYSPALMISGQALAGFAFLSQNRKLLLPLMRLKTGIHGVRWSVEIWPFQWRVALSWASSYVILQMMNPIVFACRGPVEAGRMGMSLNIANSLGAVALAWMTTKVSPFGSMIARREYKELDRLFFRTLKQSTAILIAGMIVLVAALPVIFHFFHKFQARILPLPYFCIVLLTVVCCHIVVSEAFYLRAHKREPFLIFWVIIAIVSGVSLLWLGRHWGTAGVVVGYFVCGGVLRCLAGTYAFFKKRREWHADDSAQIAQPV